MTDEKIEKVENLVVKIVSVLVGLSISIMTYLIQDKMTEMTSSMKAIERTLNDIQLQQVGFQKDVEYLRIDQANIIERIKRLERR